MDRKRYLEIRQQSVFNKNIVVFYNGKPYFPLCYILDFDENGNAIHAVKLKDTKAKNSFIWCKLSEVHENEKEDNS
jgi:hypothetical protein